MKRPAYCFLAITLAVVGCSAPSPLAPGPSPSATIRGWVYASVAWGEPPVPGAQIEVHAADGSKTTTVSDLNGFYQLSVPIGNVTITTSKVGYETKTYQVMLLTHTTLNFSLEQREDRSTVAAISSSLCKRCGLPSSRVVRTPPGHRTGTLL